MSVKTKLENGVLTVTVRRPSSLRDAPVMRRLAAGLDADYVRGNITPRTIWWRWIAEAGDVFEVADDYGATYLIVEGRGVRNISEQEAIEAAAKRSPNRDNNVWRMSGCAGDTRWHMREEETLVEYNRKARRLRLPEIVHGLGHVCGDASCPADGTICGDRDGHALVVKRWRDLNDLPKGTKIVR